MPCQREAGRNTRRSSRWAPLPLILRLAGPLADIFFESLSVFPSRVGDLTAQPLDAAGVHIPDYQKQSLAGPFTGLPSLSLDEWGAIVQFCQKRCAYCGGPYEVIDHFLPLSQGGTTWRGNVVPACFVCANARRDRPHDQVIETSVMEHLAAELKRRAQSDQG